MPGQNGSRERGFGATKDEWLFREEIGHTLQLVGHINAYRADYRDLRPHETITWKRLADVHAGLACTNIANFAIEAAR